MKVSHLKRAASKG